MKTAERTRIAFQRGTPDRVPIHCWLGLPLIKKLRRPVVPRPLRALDRRPDGVDREDAAGPRARPDDHDLQPAHRRARDLAAHAVPSPETDVGRDIRDHRERRRLARALHTIRTPDGDLDYSYRTEDGFGTSCHDFLLKGDEPELRPAPLPVRRPLRHDRARGHGRKVGDEAWWLRDRTWDMAAEIRGLVDLSMDIYDRPSSCTT